MADAGRKSFLLRVPHDLWRDLEKWAADDLRSINGQVEFVLREALARRRRGAAAPAPVADGPVSGSEAEPAQASTKARSMT